uniref:Uncharacterized protein n=1 Tax=Rhizophora mucronata TaxID=61149 RepID=A0A2P2PC30_RHIMU
MTFSYITYVAFDANGLVSNVDGLIDI